MKSILSVAIILAIASFIAAQAPPAFTPQQCVPVVNSTAIAFCSTTWNYLVKNGTDLTAAANAANTQYTANLAKVTGTPSAACMTALQVYACQTNLGRCGRYQNYQQAVTARCAAVNTACGSTDFPTAGGFIGAACVANSLLTPDGANTVCFGATTTTLGANCNANVFDPKIVAPSPVAATVCPLVASCNQTQTTPTCVRPNNIGDACSTTCISNSAAPAGSALTCIAGRCNYNGKRHDVPCFDNAECLSNNCTVAGKCYESPLGGACTGSNQCRNNLYCDTKNSTCYNIALQGELCGFVQPNWSNVPCIGGYTCVRQTDNSSRCVVNANLGGACSSVVSAVVYDAPICAPSTIPTNGIAQCINNLCSLTTGRQAGEQCNVTNACVPTVTCQYTNGATNGICVTPTSVSCDTVGGGGCNVLQRCTCGATQDVTGTCAIDTSSPTAACALQNIGVQQCLKDKCGSPAATFIPYDGNSCGATQCITQINAFYCCVKGATGANYVAPTGQPADPCITPTPAPTTPGPTQTGGPTATPGPGQSSKRSGAATVAVSFVAMILAVVAFL